MDDDTSSGEGDGEPETAKQSMRSMKGLVMHPMKLIAMLKERDLVGQPEEQATVCPTTAEMHAANDERSQECDTTQRPGASSEQVGGTSHARERVVGCSAMLSTVGTELSNLVARDSPEASDRAVTLTAACHGVQRKADGIWVTDVSIFADSPISGEYSESDSEEKGSLWEEDNSSCEEEGSDQCEEEGSCVDEEASGQLTAPHSDESPYCNLKILSTSCSINRVRSFSRARRMVRTGSRYGKYGGWTSRNNIYPADSFYRPARAATTA